MTVVAMNSNTLISDLFELKDNRYHGDATVFPSTFHFKSSDQHVSVFDILDTTTGLTHSFGFVGADYEDGHHNAIYFRCIDPAFRHLGVVITNARA